MVKFWKVSSTVLYFIFNADPCVQCTEKVAFGTDVEDWVKIYYVLVSYFYVSRFSFHDPTWQNYYYKFDK